jgi:hypothetical protein
MRTLSKELIESVSSNILFMLIGSVAWYAIPNEFIRTVVIAGIVSAAVLVVIVIYLRRIVRNYVEMYGMRNFARRAAIHHKFVHQARDLCVRMLPKVEPYAAPPLVPGTTALPHPLMNQHRATIGMLLEEFTRLFEAVAPAGTKVWASLRDRRSDDCYHTFARGGRFNPNREDGSQSLHKDTSKTIKHLKHSYEVDKQCVVITGSSKGPQLWERQPNDALGEDRCVLMGAVMTKSWMSDQWGERKLAWVLSVCADRDDAFQEEHIPLMQSCVDVFSMVANIMSRSDGFLIESPSELNGSPSPKRARTSRK